MTEFFGVSLLAEHAAIAAVERSRGVLKTGRVLRFEYAHGEATLAERAAFAAERAAEVVSAKAPVALCLPGEEVFALAAADKEYWESVYGA